jgi:hypothetical protein
MNEGHAAERSFLHCSRTHFAFVVESFIEILIVVQMPNILPGAMNCTKAARIFIFRNLKCDRHVLHGYVNWPPCL